jgi:hypothetical protein
VVPVWRADPRSKLPAGPLQTALRELALPAASRPGNWSPASDHAGSSQAVLAARGRVGVAVAERVCRTVLERNPAELYGEAYGEARKYAGGPSPRAPRAGRGRQEPVGGEGKLCLRERQPRLGIVTDRRARRAPGGEQAANALQPVDSSRHTTTANAEVEAGLAA